MRGLVERFQAKIRSRRLWCSYCRERPRTDLDGDGRYCSEACQQSAAEWQAFSF